MIGCSVRVVGAWIVIVGGRSCEGSASQRVSPRLRISARARGYSRGWATELPAYVAAIQVGRAKVLILSRLVCRVVEEGQPQFAPSFRPVAAFGPAAMTSRRRQ